MVGSERRVGASGVARRAGAGSARARARLRLLPPRARAWPAHAHLLPDHVSTHTVPWEQEQEPGAASVRIQFNQTHTMIIHSTARFELCSQLEFTDLLMSYTGAVKHSQLYARAQN